LRDERCDRGRSRTILLPSNFVAIVQKWWMMCRQRWMNERQVARPREFAEATALDAATRRFWRDGFAAVSIRALAADMGIAGASLYNAFGSKRALFGRAIARYGETTTQARIARLEASLPPKDAVRAFLGEIVAHSLSDRERRGCLLVNSAVEAAPKDAAIAAEIAARFAEIEAFFCRAIRRAQAAGEVPADRDAAGLGRLLLAATLGIRVLARADPRRELLEGALRPALALLDGP
jgi:TetR/AcrR family transcriptional regulator, transcriptional repressor for nem operon